MCNFCPFLAILWGIQPPPIRANNFFREPTEWGWSPERAEEFCWMNERVFEMMIIGHITLKIWKALSSLWNVAKGLMPVVWTALIFSQLDIGKLLKRTWEDLLRVSGPCTGDQGTQKASGKVAVLSKREDFAKENWDFIWTFHLHCSNSLYIFSNPIKDIFL